MRQCEPPPHAPRQVIGCPLEIWGGVEYTCNRVGERYFDQMEFSGHANRMGDYAKFLELGIKTLRIGILWERHEMDPSWRWQDERLNCLRSLGIQPIVGLVHHGSGPKHTSLLDSAFPLKLAAYARSVAARYPWVEAYTPVNEPHTTARFSALYGVWFPHHQSRESYLQALLLQVKATVLSMQAIREVRPDARLIQTEDVGNISGTEELRSTWEMLNERQWLSYDLLCGRVNAHHPVFRYLLAGGLTEEQVLWFADNPCPPSVVGINYYVTSDRYLDHRMNLYPEDRQSAEGPFVDVEAVRVRDGGIAGVAPLVEKASSRYSLPVAVTEVHLGCTVDEQIRWLAESWQEALKARRNGANCVALTVWAMLGSHYWNQLVTSENGHYEPGTFDLSSGQVRATELATVVAQMTAGIAPRHPVLTRNGWWHQAGRSHFPPSTR